jgi:DNA-binding Lrp family transcriptional regulator
VSVVRPNFLQVQPEDIRYGYDGACVLALVRYVTGLSGERNGRRLIGGEMWWHTSQPDIAASLGGDVSHDSIRRTVKKLEAAGVLLSRGVNAADRAKAYRVADQPGRENALTVTSHDAKSPDPEAKSPDPRREIASGSSITEELEEQEIEGRGRARACAPEPPPRRARALSALN